MPIVRITIRKGKSSEYRKALLDGVHNALVQAFKSGGHFVNMDVILAPSEKLEQWYLSLWKDWIEERKAVLGISHGKFDNIIQQYKDAEENKPDTLDDQLLALRDAGFQDVDCYYKYGIFTMIGGRK